jgi:uncharacterized Ntn-hydrolase superfamily protein
MAKGMTAEEALKSLKDGDKSIQSRQLGLIDAKGNAVSYTGPKCQAWAGGKTGKYYACQGNILVSEKVVDEMAKAFEETKGALALRLMAALEAGEKVGGDKRKPPPNSAAILVVREGKGPNGIGDRYIDLRVDEHKDPIPELARILNMRIGKMMKKGGE